MNVRVCREVGILNYMYIDNVFNIQYIYIFFKSRIRFRKRDLSWLLSFKCTSNLFVNHIISACKAIFNLIISTGRGRSW